MQFGAREGHELAAGKHAAVLKLDFVQVLEGGNLLFGERGEIIESFDGDLAMLADPACAGQPLGQTSEGSRDDFADAAVAAGGTAGDAEFFEVLFAVTAEGAAAESEVETLGTHAVDAIEETGLGGGDGAVGLGGGVLHFRGDENCLAGIGVVH